MSICFCTLAIHEPYRQRAKVLCRNTKDIPWIILTDVPEDFSALPVQAILHTPTGPMAPDYLSKLYTFGEGKAGAAYHDKRFAILAALKNYDTAIYIDADSVFTEVPILDEFPDGISVYPVVQKSIFEHLTIVGTWRLPFFEELAVHLTGNTDILKLARWCFETPIAIKKDGKESNFFTTWEVAANFMQGCKVYSGEGGVIGLAAAICGWQVNFDAIIKLADCLEHEGGGPKQA